MAREWIRSSFSLVIGLSLCLGFAASARAQYIFRPRGANGACPPDQILSAPCDPHRPAAPARPKESMRPGESSRTPESTAPDADRTRQDQDRQETPPPDTSSSQDFSQAPSAETSGAGGPMSSGASTPFAGRLDMNNRFNLFDNMSAIPRTRVWFNYQFANQQNSGVRFSPFAGAASNFGVIDQSDNTQTFAQAVQTNEGLTGDITQRGKQNAYRVGAEFAFSPYTSISAQGVYFDPYGTQDPEFGFGNPEFLLKQVMIVNDWYIVSGSLGVCMELGHQKAALVDEETRILPGLLAYAQLSRDLFVQCAGQFNFATETRVHTFDWATGFGYWLYRHESLSGYFNRPHGPFLRGIVPQIEFFGKHVLDNNNVPGAFGLSTTPPRGLDGGPLYINNGVDPFIFDQGDTLITQPIFQFREPRDVVDMTCAVQFILGGGVAVTTGVSFPLSGNQNRVRDTEFLATVNYYY